MEVEKFRGTSGRLGGAFTLALAAVIFTVGLVELDRGFPPWVMAVALLFAVLSWASALRPSLRVEQATLVMTNMFETVRIPLAAIDEVGVRQVLTVRAAGRSHASSAIGRSARPIVLGGKGHLTPGSGESEKMSHADFVEQRLSGLAEEARRVASSRPGSTEQLALADGVRRDRAWLPIVLVALASLACVVSLFW